MPLSSAFRKPPALRPGDPVVVIAPSSPFDQESLATGLALLQRRYDVRHTEGIFARERYLAGADSRRLPELLLALTDPTTRAVFCARGGYGVTRLLAQLTSQLPDGERLPPKPLVGFSDITALHGVLRQLGRVSIHGPVLTQLGKLEPAAVSRLFALLESGEAPAPLVGSASYCDGVAEGVLAGGNLTVLAASCGTPFMPSLDGAILLLEDVGEKPYRLDRQWTQLSLAGVFRQVRGIALGEFVDCELPGSNYTSQDVLRELAHATGLPCVAGLPVGHGAINEAVALGVRVRLDADARTLTFLEGAVTPALD
jgi:muramoyltetrapeptide carboxypeptidase